MHFSLNCAKQLTTLFPMKKVSFVPSVPCVKFAYFIKASNLHYAFNQAKYKCSSFLAFQQPLCLSYLLLNWAANHNCFPIRCYFINQLVKQPIKIKQPNVVDLCEPKSTKQSNCLTLEARPELRRHYEDQFLQELIRLCLELAIQLSFYRKIYLPGFMKTGLANIW